LFLQEIGFCRNLAKEAGLLDTPLTGFLYAARSRLREMKTAMASAVAG
jgi:hypothetical protein